MEVCEKRFLGVFANRFDIHFIRQKRDTPHKKDWSMLGKVINHKHRSWKVLYLIAAHEVRFMGLVITDQRYYQTHPAIRHSE